LIVGDEPGFRIDGSRTLAAHGFLRLELLDVVGPTGDHVERLAIRHPGAVAVLPIDVDEVVLMRQFRAPLGDTLLEVPAGKLDVTDEPPIETAARELEEEVGLRAGRIEPVFGFWTTPGFTDEFIHLFVATDLEPVAARPHGLEETAADIVRIPIRDVERAIAAGEIRDVKTLVALQWLLLRV
jgi:ADP-ribose pyrophosphatase